MSELSTAQAEQRYIDSMLGLVCDENSHADSNTHTPNRDASPGESPVTVSDNACSPQPADTEVVEAAEQDDTSLENLYQLIQVAGLKLAVPVTAISRVEPGGLSNVDNNQLLTMDGRYGIVDIARFIDASQSTKPVEQYLLIASHGYAIACAELHGMETIAPTVICRRSEKSSRVWLAGTVSEIGVAVLDLDGIAQLLD